MATTDYPVASQLAVKRWSSELMKEALKRTQLLKFMGSSSNSLIQIKTEVNKAAGDRIRFGLRVQLTGGGIIGDGTLEGYEEALETYTQDVLIDQLRHAVRSGGKMSQQRVPFTIRDEARDGLADWWADRIDAWGFNQLTGNAAITDMRYAGNNATVAPDSDHAVFTGGGTAETSLSTTTSYAFNLTLIDRAVERGKVAQNALRPIKVGSEDYLVAFLHPYQVTQLRTNTNTGQWLDIQKAAMAGGKVTDNPIFTGALGVYNGVILHESTRIPLTNSTNNVRRAVLCGAQAAMVAYGRGSGQNVYSWVEEMFDYDNQLGVAAGCIAGMIKTRFNGSDFATITMSSNSPASN